AVLQQEPGPRARPGGARQRPVPGLDRDRVRRARRRGLPARGGRVDAAPALGHARRRRRRGGVPGLAGGGRHPRTGHQCQRWRCDVVRLKEAIAMATEEKKTYSDDEVEAKIAEHGLDGWYLEDGWLRRKYNTDGWPSTLMAVNAVGYVCEAAYHHADLAVTWGQLWVKLMHHAAGRIHDKGFPLPGQNGGPVLWRPPRRQPARGNAEQVRLQQGLRASP